MRIILTGFMGFMLIAVGVESSLKTDDVCIMRNVDSLEGLGANFDQHSRSYFEKHFGQGGLLYLREFPSSAATLRGESKEGLKYLIKELKAIVNIDQHFWKRTRDDEVRYRIHRLLGILRSNPDYITRETIQYWRAFPRQQKRKLVEDVIKERLKNKLAVDLSVPPEVVCACLRLVEKLPKFEHVDNFDEKIESMANMLDYLLSWSSVQWSIAKEWFEVFLLRFPTGKGPFVTDPSERLKNLGEIASFIDSITKAKETIVNTCAEGEYYGILEDLREKALLAVLNGASQEANEIMEMIKPHAQPIPGEQDVCGTYKTRNEKYTHMSTRVLDISRFIGAAKGFEQLAKNFDTLVTWYFRKNFAIGGIDYLEVVAQAARQFNPESIEIETVSWIRTELTQIVEDQFVNLQLNYRIHRFVGALYALYNGKLFDLRPSGVGDRRMGLLLIYLERMFPSLQVDDSIQLFKLIGRFFYIEEHLDEEKMILLSQFVQAALERDVSRRAQFARLFNPTGEAFSVEDLLKQSFKVIAR